MFCFIYIVVVWIEYFQFKVEREVYGLPPILGHLPGFCHDDARNTGIFVDPWNLRRWEASSYSVLVVVRISNAKLELKYVVPYWLWASREPHILNPTLENQASLQRPTMGFGDQFFFFFLSCAWVVLNWAESFDNKSCQVRSLRTIIVLWWCLHRKKRDKNCLTVKRCSDVETSYGLQIEWLVSHIAVTCKENKELRQIQSRKWIWIENEFAADLLHIHNLNSPPSHRICIRNAYHTNTHVFTLTVCSRRHKNLWW